MMKIRQFILPCMILLVAVACSGSRSDDQSKSSSMPEESAATVRATAVPTETQAPAMTAATATAEPTAAPTPPPSLEQAILGSWRGNGSTVYAYFADGIYTMTAPDAQPGEMGVGSYSLVGDALIEMGRWGGGGETRKMQVQLPSPDTMILKEVTESDQGQAQVLRRLEGAPTQKPLAIQEGILGTWQGLDIDTTMTIEFYGDGTAITMGERGGDEFGFESLSTFEFTGADEIALRDSSSNSPSLFRVALPTNDLLLLRQADANANAPDVLTRTAPGREPVAESPENLFVGIWSCYYEQGGNNVWEAFQDGTLIIGPASEKGQAGGGSVGSYQFTGPDLLTLSVPALGDGADLQPHFPARDVMYIEPAPNTVGPSVFSVCWRQ